MLNFSFQVINSPVVVSQPTANTLFCSTPAGDVLCHGFLLWPECKCFEAVSCGQHLTFNNTQTPPPTAITMTPFSEPARSRSFLVYSLHAEVGWKWLMERKDRLLPQGRGLYFVYKLWKTTFNSLTQF